MQDKIPSFDNTFIPDPNLESCHIFGNLPYIWNLPYEPDECLTPIPQQRQASPMIPAVLINTMYGHVDKTQQLAPLIVAK